LVSALRPVTAPSQLIHGDLTGNVVFDSARPPAIIDFSPYRRPAAYAAAIVAADALVWEGAARQVLDAVRQDLVHVLADLGADVLLLQCAREADAVAVVHAKVASEPLRLPGHLSVVRLEVAALITARADGSGGRKDIARDGGPGQHPGKRLELVMPVPGGQLVQGEADLRLSLLNHARHRYLISTRRYLKCRVGKTPTIHCCSAIIPSPGVNRIAKPNG
jgi:hypothetical protein